MPVRALLVVAMAATLGVSSLRGAQAVDPGPVYRIFLANGQALPSYGEMALIGERVLFTLMVGDGSAATQYQVVSLPAKSVDLIRTGHYATTIRAARYAATRGETDYAEMTAEVSRALDEITKVEDPKQRLAMAEEAKRRLVLWSRENYGYRAEDIKDLAALFDEVIAQLRASAGLSQFSVDLMSGPSKASPEPMRPPPTLREAIDMALLAATAADVAAERDAILRAAAALAAAAPGATGLEDEVKRRVEAERAIDQAYDTMATTMRARAEAAYARADVRTLNGIRGETVARDRILGSKRPGALEALLLEIDEKLSRAQAHRVVLAQYAALRPRLAEYEERVRPVLSVLDGAGPSLQAMRDMVGPGIYWLQRVEANLKRAQPWLQATVPPDELQDIHGTITSALQMAIEACRNRRLVLATRDLKVDREASAAAAGALLLGSHARKELLARLHPPKIQ